jgi:uncharacterized protein YndB with AHSA1/START domain
MPIRKDDSGRRWVELELLVPGTPEQVWEALATGNGNAGWFVRAEIEPRVGGALCLDFGNGATSPGEVTRWDPPRSFGYVEREWQEGAPPVATEITITGRAGDRCVVRMVHSLFAATDDWDDQLEGFEGGWPGFFALLRVYLQHFAGMPAGSFMAMAPAHTDSLSAWRRLNDALGLAGASVGERRTASGGPDRFAGVVEHVYQDGWQWYLLLRVDEPAPGLVLVGTHQSRNAPAEMEVKLGMSAGGASVSVCRYFYGEDAGARAAESERRWREWFATVFATPATV